jgi:hypothetical protein
LLEPGNRGRWREGDLYQSLAARGHIVCAADLRGIGDLMPEIGRGSALYARDHGDDESYAWASLILGRSLVGQRVTDLLAVAAALHARPEAKGRQLIVAARGKTTVPAQIAAALDPAIDRLYLAEGLLSFESVVRTEAYRAEFANFVPRLLLHTDLPEIAASLRPRRVVLAASVTASGTPADPQEIRRLYPDAEVRSNGIWSPEVLNSLSIP